MPALLLLLCGAPVAWQAEVPLTRDGGQLIYDGKPFAAVGVNKHELLSQYLAALLGAPADQARAAREAAETSLAAMQQAGLQVARVRVSCFWPAEQQKTFLSDDPEVREASWQALDAMLDACDRHEVRVVASIAWHLSGWADLAHESLQDLFGNPHSASRQALDAWITELVARYRQRDTILFWELGNEANLGADLRPQFPEGILRQPGGPAEHLFHAPVVRDVRNNYSSDELAALTRELCAQIKALDPDKLVGTGFSAPRPAAWHLWLGSIRRADKMDWTRDSAAEAADYLRLITPSGVDLISLHSYGQEFERLLPLMRAAQGMGVPVYVGEMGMSQKAFGERVYDNAKAIQGLRLELAALHALRFPLVLAWTWDEWGQPAHEPILRPDTQPNVVEALTEANRRAGAEAGSPPADDDALTGELQRLAADYAALTAVTD